jgi:hypothetical protein
MKEITAIRKLDATLQKNHVLLKTLKSRTLSLLKMGGKEGSSSKDQTLKTATPP